jgi:RNA polymerase sigma-70 factor (ECF subfamily)
MPAKLGNGARGLDDTTTRTHGGARRGERLVHEQDVPAALAAALDANFARLVMTYQDRLYAFVLRLTANAPDAEEMVADAFVRAYHALARYPAERVRALALRPWLYQIVRNVFHNRVRGRRLRLVPLDRTGEGRDPGFPDDAAERPDAVLERAELREALTVRLMALPERERVAVVLHHVQGWGYGEIAALVGQPVGTVKAHVHRGIERLRAVLSADGAWR